MASPKVDYGYRDTVFFKEQPKIVNINAPFINTAYEIFYGSSEREITGGSIFLNDAHTLSFVQNGPKGKRPYYVAEKFYAIGTPEYPLGFFIPFSASSDAMRQAAILLNALADGNEETRNQPGEFFDYDDFGKIMNPGD